MSDLSNVRDPWMNFSQEWLKEMFGLHEGFEGFSEAELKRISELSETVLLKEAIRLVMKARKPE